MRVLLINTLYPPDGDGGAERSVAELAEDLRAHEIDVGVAALTSSDAPTNPADGSVQVYRWRPPGAWPFSSQDRSLRTKVRWHAGETYRQSARAFVRSVLRDFRPDIVHTNNIAGFGVAILRDVSHYPWVHTLRDYYLLCPRTTLFRNGVRCERRCVDCVALTGLRHLPRPGPSQIVAVSQRVADIHQNSRVWLGSTFNVVPNTTQRLAVARRYVERIGTVGFLGRLNEAKGLGLLLRLFSQPEMRSLHLLVAGPRGSDAEGDLRALLKLPNVTDLGVVHPNFFFSKIDLLLVPSQWEEPFGRVLAEASSVAVPALVSDRGGLADTGDEDDRVKIVQEPASVKSWLEAIAFARTGWQRFWVGGTNLNMSGPAAGYMPIYREALPGPGHLDTTGTRSPA